MKPDAAWIKAILLVIILSGGLTVILSPAPEGLSSDGMKALGIAIICVALWIFNTIPLAATSLLAIVLLPMLEVLDARHVFSYFGNSAVFFLMGVFILAGAMVHTGFSKRLALMFLSRFDAGPRTVVFGIMFFCSFLALFMPAHAVAAMLFPVVMEITRALDLKKNSPLATAMFLSLGWGAIIGSNGTFLGGARAPLAVEFLWEAFQQRISFAYWAAAALPVTVVFTVVAYLVVIYYFKPEIKNITPARQLLSQEMARIGSITANEIKIGLLVLLTVLVWIFGGHKIGLAVISLAAAVLVFALDIAKWLDVMDYVNWGVIIMYGGAIALGKALSETHAIDWLAMQIVGSAELSPFILIVLLSGLTKIITELVSNAAAVVVLIPFSFGFVSTLDVAPRLLVLAITIPAGLAF
ncbi:DASS family sodium-coupled anion symporter, partial [candidate division KSB1 bacterium]|nr:DASS family sodium-coupled anion symporter [candidate division KSB1 bacterium]